MVEIKGKQYKILTDQKDAFSEEAFEERYSEVLKKYDYIVGDWGYGQLRLKGFYNEKHPKANYDTRIDFLEDYLYEYCNFGCAYFVLQVIDK